MLPHFRSCHLCLYGFNWGWQRAMSVRVCDCQHVWVSAWVGFALKSSQGNLISRTRSAAKSATEGSSTCNANLHVVAPANGEWRMANFGGALAEAGCLGYVLQMAAMPHTFKHNNSQFRQRYQWQRQRQRSTKSKAHININWHFLYEIEHTSSRKNLTSLRTAADETIGIKYTITLSSSIIKNISTVPFDMPEWSI